MNIGLEAQPNEIEHDHRVVYFAMYAQLQERLPAPALPASSLAADVCWLHVLVSFFSVSTSARTQAEHNWSGRHHIWNLKNE